MPAALPPTAAGLNDAALDLLDRGSAAEALEAWRRALELDPLHFESLLNSTLVSWRLGHETDADGIARLERWRAATGGGGPAALALGLVHLERRDLDAAQPLLFGQDAGRDRPSEVESLFQAVRAQGALERTARVKLGDSGSFPQPIALARDGSVLLVGEGKDVVVRKTTDLAEVARLTGHTGKVETLAVTPDGRWAASGAQYDATLRIWDLLSPGESRVLVDADLTAVQSVTLSADGQTAVTVCLEPKCAAAIEGQLRGMEEARQRDAEAREAELRAGLIRPPLNLGSYIPVSAFPQDRVVHLWDLASGTAHVIERGPTAAHCVRFSPDGSRVVVSTKDTGHPDPNRRAADVVPLRVLDVARRSFSSAGAATALAIVAGASGSVRPPARLEASHVLDPSLALDVGGRYALRAVARDQDSDLRVLDLGSGRCLRTIDPGHRVDAVEMSGDARMAVVGWCGGKLLETWRLPASWEPVVPLRRSADRAASPVRLAESSAEELRTKAEKAIARGEFEDARHRLAALRDRSGHERTPESLGGWARLYRHCRREGLRATWIVREWDGKDGRVRLAPDGSSIARFGDEHDAVIFEDPRTGRIVRRLEVAADSRIASLDFSENMRYFAAGGYAVIVVWDLKTGRRRAHAVRHYDAIRSLRIADDGRRARFRYQGNTLVWDGSEETRPGTDPLSDSLARGERPLGALGDGRWRFELARPSGPLDLVDARDGTRRTLVPDAVTHVEVSRDGEWLLTLEPTRSFDHRACLRFLDWDLGPA